MDNTIVSEKFDLLRLEIKSLNKKDEYKYRMFCMHLMNILEDQERRIRALESNHGYSEHREKQETRVNNSLVGKVRLLKDFPELIKKESIDTVSKDAKYNEIEESDPFNPLEGDDIPEDEINDEDETESGVINFDLVDEFDPNTKTDDEIPTDDSLDDSRLTDFKDILNDTIDEMIEEDAAESKEISSRISPKLKDAISSIKNKLYKK